MPERDPILHRAPICIVDGPPPPMARGPQLFLVEYSQWLRGRGVEGAVICGSRRRIATCFPLNDPEGIKNTVVSEKFSAIRFFPTDLLSVFYSLISFIMILIAIRRYKIAIIHSQDSVYAGMASTVAGKIARVPTVIMVHGINRNVMKPDSHGKGKIRETIGWLHRSTYLRIRNITMSESASILCVGEDTCQFLPNFPNKTAVRLGVDLHRFRADSMARAKARKKFGISQETIVFGYIGSLSKEKRIDIVLEGFSQVLRKTDKNRPILFLVGDGPERSRLSQMAQSLGIEEFTRFTGFVEDISDYLHATDIALLASESEGMPLSILEAMAAGKAIIAFNIPAVEEILSEDEAILVNNGSREEFAQAMVGLWSSPENVSKIGAKASEKSRQFNIDIANEKILEICQSLALKS